VKVHPNRTATDLAIAGMLAVAIGVVLRQAAIVAWGGALLVGLAIARAVTRLSIARIRASGFEMLWREEPRHRRVARGDTVQLLAEVRNRDHRAARFVELRPVASPELEVSLSPAHGEVPASGGLAIEVNVTVPRVGRHGLHGLSLEVQGSPGLFEVPLTFANPFGLDVLPRPFFASLRSARGGRSRMAAHAGRPGPLSGDGYELRELREHQTGDPFKRIAWKATARLGKLLVRDHEREERDVVWLLLDASVELWAGDPGTAPLDVAIDEVAAVAQHHLAQGDRVGLAIIASRVLAWSAPDRGPAHGAELLDLLAHATATVDVDRSDLDETDVAARVLDHMRPLDPVAARRVKLRDLDRLARRADRVRARAPLASSEPYSHSPRERALRRYLEAFGIYSPPRIEPDRQKTDVQLAAALSRLCRERPRPSVVYVWSPPSDPVNRPDIKRALLRHPRRRIELRWVSMSSERSIPHTGTPLAPSVGFAVTERARAAEERGERALRRIGVRVQRIHPRLRQAGALGAPEPRARDDGRLPAE
jgi:uncharacterized protein (DUF58 family)